MNTTLAAPTVPVAAGTTTLLTFAGGIWVAASARSRTTSIERSVWMLCHAAAIQMRSADGSLAITRWSWVSAAIRIVPWFADRARSPVGKSWRAGAGGRTVAPPTGGPAALGNAPEDWYLRVNGVVAGGPPLEAAQWVAPP